MKASISLIRPQANHGARLPENSGQLAPDYAQLRQEANQRFREVLRQGRMLRGLSVAEAALGLGLTESEWLEMESRPAEIPARKLSKIIQYLGPDASYIAGCAWTDLQLEAYESRQNSAGREGGH